MFELFDRFKLFDTLRVILKEFFEKNDYEKSQQMTTKAWNFTQYAKRVNKSKNFNKSKNYMFQFKPHTLNSSI